MNAFSRTFLFVFAATIMTSVVALAAFDVSVHFNGGSDVVYIGEDNILEVYLTNETAIAAMSLGLNFSNSAGAFQLVTPYGTRPQAPAAPYIMEHGDANIMFPGVLGLLGNFSLAPNDILFGGVNGGPDPTLPAHATSTFLYSMKVRIPAGLTPTPDGFCVDNVFYSPAGNWLMVYFDEFDVAQEVVPTFQGQASASQLDPDAPAVCFDLVQRPPCDPPQITNCPMPLATTFYSPAVYDLNATTPGNGAITWSVSAIDPVVNAPTINSSGLFSFGFALSEGGSVKQFRAIATNDCGSADTCIIAVNHLGIAPFLIKIEKTHGTFQGNYEYVSITKESGSNLMGGFDFLIAYDASALMFNSAQLGVDIGPTGCGWEYFTFRYGAQGNCGGPCPSGLLRVVAIADANNGANHPDCYSAPDGGELVRLKFFVTNDRTFECQYVPIRFAWMDCGDNGISSVGGDTLWISTKVFEFENTNPLIDPSYEITDSSCYFAVSYGGACVDCNVSGKYEPLRFVIFWNGGIDIACSDSIDAPGDLNLNDIAYEIADAVLYTNYFLYGLSALDPNPQFREAQIAASDANNDGRTLTVGDLVYLLRVIVGDAVAFDKLMPFANSANVSVTNGVVTVDSPVEIGAVCATFKTSGAYSFANATDMTVLSSENDGVVKVLLYSGLDDMRKHVEAGRNELLTISGDAELVSVEVADYDGNMLNTRVSKGVIPSEFKLAQNTPNPFNPTTRINLDLPVSTEWSLEIFNVAGQLVKSYSGRGVGSVTVEWDASDQPSGVYFYKATAGAAQESRKMLLLK